MNLSIAKEIKVMVMILVTDDNFGINHDDTSDF